MKTEASMFIDVFWGMSLTFSDINFMVEHFEDFDFLFFLKHIDWVTVALSRKNPTSVVKSPDVHLRPG